MGCRPLLVMIGLWKIKYLNMFEVYQVNVLDTKRRKETRADTAQTLIGRGDNGLFFFLMTDCSTKLTSHCLHKNK